MSLRQTPLRRGLSFVGSLLPSSCQQRTRHNARMDTEQLKAFCAARPGATVQLYAPPSNVLVYAVGNKTFAYFKTSEPERWRFSIKVTPERFVELTDVPGIKPARWMGRHRWVTIV